MTATAHRTSMTDLSRALGDVARHVSTHNLARADSEAREVDKVCPVFWWMGDSGQTFVFSRSTVIASFLEYRATLTAQDRELLRLCVRDDLPAGAYIIAASRPPEYEFRLFQPSDAWALHSRVN